MRIKRTEKDAPLLVALTDLECKVLAGLVRGESLKSLSVALSISPEPVLETKNALMGSSAPRPQRTSFELD